MLFKIFVINFCVLLVQSINQGQNAAQELHKFQVSVRLDKQDKQFGNGYICSGALISNRDVLVPAQCVFNGAKVRPPKEFKIVMGTMSRINATGATVRSISKVWVHDSYKSATKENDLAILRIVKPIVNTVIQAIVLNSNALPWETTCSFSGWGANMPNTPMANTLQVGYLKNYVQTVCERAYGGRLYPGMLCMSAGPNAFGGPCMGDAGAPLICNGMLSGILTIIDGCGNVNSTSIFMNTQYHYGWIMNTMTKSSASVLSLSSYLILSAFLLSKL